MPYQQNKPEANDQLNDSQGDIQGNFQEIYNLVGVNHEQFGAANGQGKHTQVTLPENGAPVATLINEANIYAKESILTKTTELFWQRENNGNHIEWTGAQQADDGWTYLPSGILLKWGIGTSTGTGSVITFPAATTIPVFKNIFNVTAVSRSNSAIGITVTAKGVANFTVNTFQTNLATPSGSTLYYFAIGN